MSDTTNTAESGAGAAAPADTTPSVTAQQTQGEQTTELTDEQREAAAQAEAAKQAEEKRKNRTKTYIDRINAERAELARRVAELESRQSQHQPRAQPQQADAGPKLEDYGYDFNAYQQARDAWVLDQAEKRITTNARQQAEQAREQETISAYNDRAAEFADQHPDFEEVVGSIPQAYLPPHLQAAILAHPNGPQIAYHLGNNEDDAFALASTQPHLAAAAVQRLAARLGAAPAPQPNAASAPAPKPITKAPPPTPTVGGRASAPKDPERMTTEEWRAWRESELKKRG